MAGGTREIDYGDLDGGFARADYVREDTFELPAVSPAYLEPCASLAVLMLGPGTDITQATIRALAENTSAAIFIYQENRFRYVNRERFSSVLAIGLLSRRIPPGGGASDRTARSPCRFCGWTGHA